MSKITTVLFDFDGVIVDTERQYDEFFIQMNERKQLGVDDFAESLKGKRIVEALDLLYPQFSDELKKEIVAEATVFELAMDYPLVAGAIDFIRYLKSAGYKIGLVTSSHEEKMEVAMNKLSLNGVFDTEVMAGRIAVGKPDPMCYLLAAQDLGVAVDECVVFEDSFAGVTSGVAAGMKTIGVSTTLPKEVLEKITPHIISDFGNLEEVKALL